MSPPCIGGVRGGAPEGQFREAAPTWVAIGISAKGGDKRHGLGIEFNVLAGAIKKGRAFALPRVNYNSYPLSIIQFTHLTIISP